MKKLDLKCSYCGNKVVRNIVIEKSTCFDCKNFIRKMRYVKKQGEVALVDNKKKRSDVLKRYFG